MTFLCDSLPWCPFPGCSVSLHCSCTFGAVTTDATSLHVSVGTSCSTEATTRNIDPDSKKLGLQVSKIDRNAGRPLLAEGIGNPDVAAVESITGGSVAIDKGIKAGLKQKDRLLVVRKQDDRWRFIGLFEITRPVSHEAVAVMITGGDGPAEGDEAYVVNRDNSKFSLSRSHVFDMR